MSRFKLYVSFLFIEEIYGQIKKNSEIHELYYICKRIKIVQI